MPTNIVVLGAGVTGLTNALLLARSGKYSITVIAKHMPGDYDIEYASPWAGANYLPLTHAKKDVETSSIPPPSPALMEKASVGKPGTTSESFERATWPELARLASDLPEAGIHFQGKGPLCSHKPPIVADRSIDSVIYRRAKDIGTATGNWFAELLKEDAWFKDVVPNFRVLPKSELPPGIDGGTSFTSVCINTALYLPWLASQCLKHGVVIRRGIATHIADAANFHHTGSPADLVVNCTGLSSLKLGGVEDTALYPARGQIVVVRNDPHVMASVSGTDDGSDEATYVMHRAAGGGCVLGGCLQKDNWESQVDPNLAIRIMKRCVELCPKLVPEGKGVEALSIVRHGVGLRPMRMGGIRVERGVVKGPDGKAVSVVHNYGHGGYGYQTSYGAARAAERLVEEALGSKARL